MKYGKKNHENECLKNFTLKTSRDMERVAAVAMWKRSIAKNGMRYKSLVIDGDTNIYNAICKAKPYGDILPKKLECLNHAGETYCKRFKKST